MSVCVSDKGREDECLSGYYARLYVSSLEQSAPSILSGRQVHLSTAAVFFL